MSGGIASGDTISVVSQHLPFVLGLICGILIAYAITTGERCDTRDELRRLRAIVADLRPDAEGTIPIPGRRHHRRHG